MKAKVYLRVAKHPHGRNASFKVHASTKADARPLTAGSGFSERALPTIAFAVVVNIPDEAFKAAEQVLAEIDVPADLLAVAGGDVEVEAA